jgi:hypothetical protein
MYRHENLKSLIMARKCLGYTTIWEKEWLKEDTN